MQIPPHVHGIKMNIVRLRYEFLKIDITCAVFLGLDLLTVHSRQSSEHVICVFVRMMDAHVSNGIDFLAYCLMKLSVWA